MNKDRIHRLFIVLLGILCLFLTACDPPEVVIQIDPDLQSSTLQIDFIKVNRVQLNTWLEKNIDEFFSPEDLFRRDAAQRGEVYSVYFNVPGKEFEHTIPNTHSIWRNFNFQSNRSEQDFDILILVDMPVAHDTNPEVRQRVVPLYARAWPSTFLQRWILQQRGIDKLEITITRTGVRLNPSPVSGT
ncbi:MAG: hypothetical protein LR015_06140 [Verrucomicrobia bacterium]|nr:hypothetical protein [Verrucomicrobiota bacterium]